MKKLFDAVFGPLGNRRSTPQGFVGKQHPILMLEPILTPSGLIDGGDDTPDVADIPLPEPFERDGELDLDLEGDDFANDVEIPEGDIPNDELEKIEFITTFDGDVSDAIDFEFESGYFTVGESGEVTIDYLFDGGKYQGELAIFSLEGMEDLEPGSEAFIQEAANRALSESALGHVVITDKTEGARFSGELGEADWNSGDYLGAKTFQMKSGDRFGFMLVPKGEVAEVAENPAIDGAKTPLFSLVEANPGEDAQLGQIVDVTGDGNTFVFEDLRTDGRSDRDYNDIIFQVRGATGEAALMDDFVDPAKDWRSGDLGEALITYAEPPIGVDPIAYNFSVEDQPFVGVLDTGFSGNNPDLNYDRIQLGKDWVDGDNNPLLSGGEGNEHGTHTLGLIGADQNNNLGIDGMNDDAPLWIGRAIGSGQWHESLREFVDAAQGSGQPNAVINLSLDLTQIDNEGNVTTRYEFTPQEREAIEYARQNGVLMVVAAGNDGGVMSVLGQAAQEFDNILTVGAADGLTRAAYSSYGDGLGLLAPGGTSENPVVSLMADGLGTMAGTSVATAQVTGAVSQVWAANPQLSYRQVIEIVQGTATDLEAPGWDAETGAGLLNLPAALLMAKATIPQGYGTPAIENPDTWSGEGLVTPSERAANPTAGNGGVVGTVGQGFRRPYQVRPGDSLQNIAVRQLNDVMRWSQIQQVDGSAFGAIDTILVPGQVVYLPVKYQQGTGIAVGRINISVQPNQVNANGNLGINYNVGQLAGTKTVKNFVGDNDPEDFIKFSAVPGTVVSAKLTGLTAEANLALVRDFNGNNRLDPGDIFIESNNSGTQDEILERSLQGGTYFAYINSVSGNTAYNLSLTSVGDTSVRWNMGALKPEHTLLENQVGFADQEDFFKFTAAPDTVVQASLTNLTGDADLMLARDFDGNGYISANEIFESSSNSGNSDESIERQLAGGTYYAYVKQVDGEVDYDLKLGIEVGNSLSTATSIGVLTDLGKIGDYEYDGSVSKNAPVYYRFRLDKTRGFDFAIRDFNQDLEIEILDANGNIIATGKDKVSEKIASTQLFGNQLYFARVTSTSDTPSSYRLVLNPGSSLGDKFANDDSIGFLTDKSQLGDYVESGKLDGKSADYYRFRIVDANRGFIFALRNLTADANVYLLDEDGNVLARGRDTNNPNDPFEKIADFDLFKDQLYFIQVSSPNGTPTDYDLVLNPTGALGSNVSNESSLGFINEPKRKVFHGKPGDDTDYFSTDATDYYRFRVTKDFETAIAIDNLKTQAALYLLDEKGNVITKKLSSVNGGKVVLSSQDLEKDKLYFIKVVAMDGLTANYDIIINPLSETNDGFASPNPGYTYKESDYLNALYQDNVGNRVSSRRADGYHNTGRAIDSSDGQSDRQVFALVGGEVVEAKNGVERTSNKNWKENGTVAIYNSELDKTFIYWHFDEGSIDESLEGKTIRPGDFLGKEGNTGQSFGVHTHVEVHQGRLNINMAASSTGVPANTQRLNVTQVFQEAVRKGLVKLYR